MASVKMTTMEENISKIIADTVSELFDMLGKGEVAMSRVKSVVSRFDRLPHSLVPKSVLQLAESIKARSSSRGCGPTLWKWVLQQPWRQALPLPFEIPLTVEWEDTHGKEEKIMKQVMFLPHQILGSLFAAGKMDLIAGNEALSRYWNDLSHTSWFKSHPVLSADGVDLDRIIPFRFYGDGCEAMRKQKFELMSLICPASCKSATLDTRFLITVMNSTYARGGARDLLLEYVSWSMNCLCDGHHPAYDPFGRRFDGGYHPEMAAVAGTEILPGYRAILEGIQCDQEYAKCIFGLNHFYNRKQCCHYCGVIQWTSRAPAVGEPNDPNDLYTNFSADERRKIVDLPTFMQLHGQSALCRVIGFSPDRILPDVMHICHLSLYPDAFCSVLLDLSDDQTFIRGGSRDARLSYLWSSYRQWCEDGGVQDRASKRLFMKETLLPGPGKFPEPSQKVVSATAARYFIFWASHMMNAILRQWGDNATEYMMYQAALLGSLATMEMLSLKEGRLMSEASCADYKQSYWIYRSSLNWLASHNVAAGKCRYHLRPKVHQLSHVVFGFLPQNP